jgi:hypothetical protein
VRKGGGFGGFLIEVLTAAPLFIGVNTG